MDRIVIQGGTRLRGTTSVHGCKNSALPILFSTILAQERCTIRNVPRLRDVTSTLAILDELGISGVQGEDGTVTTETRDLDRCVAPYDHVRKMRASVCALGPLLARRGRARVSLPGGCAIGVRPIDLHLKGLRALGADIRIEHGFIEAKADRLQGTYVFLGGPFGSTVTGTANVMMAATMARGKTVIDSAACEPEVVDLAGFLNAMGARIRGAGSHRIEIEGVPDLGGADYTIHPDRIEAATFLIAGALTRGNVVVDGAYPHHLGAFLDFLSCAGVPYVTSETSVHVVAENVRHFHPVDVTTLPYPGFPTDLQAQAMAVLSLAHGISVVTEKVYPDRFIHVAELNRMGANIRKEGPLAIISGVDRLTGAPVMASDLRASASLVIAALMADGVTEVNRVYHIDRGYEQIEERLSALGAKITRVRGDEVPSRAAAGLGEGEGWTEPLSEDQETLERLYAEAFASSGAKSRVASV